MSAVIENTPVPTPQGEAAAVMSVIERASRDGNIEVAERMLAMQERILERNAKLAFDQAMRDCQLEMPKIVRNKPNEQTSSKYADLERVNEIIVPVYTKHGFSLSFGTADSKLDSHIKITCEISHVSGHSKHRECDMPLDMNGIKGNANKTATHAHGSTMSYGRRYLTLLIFNITLTNEDNDGNRRADQSPDGYEKWKADMIALADNGTAKLQAGWEASAEMLRKHVMRNDKQWWVDAKAKASKVAA